MKGRCFGISRGLEILGVLANACARSETVVCMHIAAYLQANDNAADYLTFRGLLKPSADISHHQSSASRLSPRNSTLGRGVVFQFIHIMASRGQGCGLHEPRHQPWLSTPAKSTSFGPLFLFFKSTGKPSRRYSTTPSSQKYPASTTYSTKPTRRTATKRQRSPARCTPTPRTSTTWAP